LRGKKLFPENKQFMVAAMMSFDHYWRALERYDKMLNYWKKAEQNP
jgi:hypothetical protein